MKPDFPLIDTTFVAFDLETTGLTPVIDRIIEIGAVRFRTGETLDTFQTLVDPGIPISPGATATNCITDDMVKGQPTIDKVLPGFIDFLGQDIPIAHHAPFDVGFLAYDISRLNLKPADRPVLDTCTIPKSLFPHAHAYNLEYLVAFLNIQTGILHRALADAEACMGVFSRCVMELGGWNRTTLEDILSMNGPALSLSAGEILLGEPFYPLKEALAKGADLEIRYQAAGGSISVRKITPLSIGLFRGTAMIEAFCHLRKDKRNFRLDRILEIR
jgi:DNA polymerase III subunit epsilon